MEYGHEFQYLFGPFCLDPNRRMPLRDGERVALTAKSLATLVALVERAGETGRRGPSPAASDRVAIGSRAQRLRRRGIESGSRSGKPELVAR